MQYLTTYFRQTFNVANPAAVRPEPARCCVTTAPSSTSTAPRSRGPTCRPTTTSRRSRPRNVDGAAESTYFSFTPPPGVLVAGTNTVAVEVHQNTRELGPQLRPRARGGRERRQRRRRTPPDGTGCADPRRSRCRTRCNCRGTPSTDDTGVTQYIVQRNGTPIGSTSETSFIDVPVGDGYSYSYTVVARDAAGNTSARVQRGRGHPPGRHAPRRCRARSRHQASRRTG